MTVIKQQTVLSYELSHSHLFYFIRYQLEFEENTDATMCMLRRHNIPMGLRLRVENFLWHKEHSSVCDFGGLATVNEKLAHLSTALRMEVRAVIVANTFSASAADNAK